MFFWENAVVSEKTLIESKERSRLACALVGCLQQNAAAGCRRRAFDSDSWQELKARPPADSDSRQHGEVVGTAELPLARAPVPIRRPLGS